MSKFLIYFSILFLVSCSSSNKPSTNYSNISNTPPPPPAPVAPPVLTPSLNQCYTISKALADNVYNLFLANSRFAYFDVSQNQQKPDGPYRIQAVTFRQSATYSGYFHVLFNNKEYDLSNIYVETSPSYFESLARKIGCTRDKSVRAVRLSN